MRNKFEFNPDLLKQTLSLSKKMLLIVTTLCLLPVLFQIGNLFFNLGTLPDGLRIRPLTGIALSLLTFISISFQPFKRQSLRRNIFEGLLILFCFASSMVYSTYPGFFELPYPEFFHLPPSSAVCILLLTAGHLIRKLKGLEFAKIYQLFFLAAAVIALSIDIGFLIEKDSIQNLFFFNGSTLLGGFGSTLISVLMCLIEPQYGWMPILTAENIGSRLLRKSLILSFPALGLAIALAHFGISLDLYSHDFAFNLVALSSFLIFGLALFAISMHLNTVDQNHRKAIENLKNREQDLWNSQNLAHVGSWKRPLSGNQVTWSPKMYEIFGIEAGTPIVSEMMDDYIPADDLKKIRIEINNGVQSGKRFSFQHPVRRKDGKTRIVRHEAEMRVNSLNGQKEIHGTIHDITDMQVILDQLRAAEKQYNDLYNESPDMLLSVDSATRLINKCNRTLLRNLGYEAAEVIGQPITKLYHPDSAKQLPDIHHNFLLSGEIKNKELIVLTKDGRQLDVSLSSTAIRDEHGRIKSSRSNWRDISDIKKARELSIREQAAAEGSRIKSNFVATMSHEIRTPLNAVVGLTEILMATPLSPEQRDYADTIKQSTDTLLILVNDILDFSKIESGKLELSVEDFSLHSLLSDIQKQMNWAASRKNLALEFKLAEAFPAVYKADRNRIKQILVNLISNAIKFTPHGYVRVSVESVALAGSTSKLLFSVEDTGIGMSTEVLHCLFQPFSQTDSSISRRFGGTGLGLSISQSLAKLMNSEIKVISEVQRGSKFSFSIDCPSSAFSEKLPITQLSEVQKFSKAYRILVAEDVETNRKVLEIMLADLGCKVVFSNDGREAVSKLESNDFDLVLMDCHMPEMDGYTATRYIRDLQDAAKSKTTIVALTASASTADRDECLKADMDDYLSKPFTRLGLEAMLSKWLIQDKNQSEIPTQSQTDFVENEADIGPVFEERLLRELNQLNRPGQPGVVQELVTLFQKNKTNRIQRIQNSLNQRSLAEIKQSTHTLKSSASALGSKSLGQLCDQIFMAAEKNRFEETGGLLTQLENECDQLISYVQNWITLNLK